MLFKSIHPIIAIDTLKVVSIPVSLFYTYCNTAMHRCIIPSLVDANQNERVIKAFYFKHVYHEHANIYQRHHSRSCLI